MIASSIIDLQVTPDLAVSMPWPVASTDSASHSSYLVQTTVLTQIPATFESMLFQPRSGMECLRNRGYHHTTATILRMHRAFTTESVRNTEFLYQLSRAMSLTLWNGTACRIAATTLPGRGTATDHSDLGLRTQI